MFDVTTLVFFVLIVNNYNIDNIESLEILDTKSACTLGWPTKHSKEMEGELLNQIPSQLVPFEESIGPEKFQFEIQTARGCKKTLHFYKVPQPIFTR